MQKPQPESDQKLEYVTCCLCGEGTFDNVLTSYSVDSSGNKPLGDVGRGERERFNLVKCRNCGLQLVNPRPARQDMGRYYSEDYYAHTSLKIRKPRGNSSLPGKWASFKDDVRRLIRIRFYNYPHSQEDKGKGVSFFKNIFVWYFYLTYRSRLDILPFTGKGRILDIGCGNGRWLSALRKLGWQTSGVEKNRGASGYARDKLHLDVRTGDLLDYRYRDKSFDVVTMWHSLEHLYDPLRTLKEIGRILNNNGLLVIAVPNIDCFIARVFKTYWYGLQLPIHLIAFTPESITKMLKSAGFDVKKIFYDRRGATLKLSLLNLRGGKYGFLSGLSHLKALIKMFNFVLAMFGSCDIIVIHAGKKG